MFLKGPGAGKGDDHDSWSVRPRSSQSQPLNYDLPSLSLVTIFTAQRQNELFGSLLKLPESFRSRLPDEAQNLFLQDQSKAQVLGHSAALAARLAQSAVNHILFAKGQVPETVASLNRQNQVQKDGSVPSRPARAPRSSAWRKREQVLICISRMAAALEEAIRRIQAASDPLACSSKQSPYPSHGGDLEILLVLGPSASSPKELFLLSMKGALLHPHLALGCDADQIGSILADHQVACEKVDPQSRHGTTRVKAREKVSGLLERKLVRFMVSDHQVEEGLGNALAPTKTFIFIRAPRSFSCPGWVPRQSLRFNLRNIERDREKAFGYNEERGGLSLSSHSEGLENEPCRNQLDDDEDKLRLPKPPPGSFCPGAVPREPFEAVSIMAHFSKIHSGQDWTQLKGGLKTEMVAEDSGCDSERFSRSRQESQCSSTSLESSHQEISSGIEESKSESFNTSFETTTASDENGSEELARLSEALSPQKRSGAIHLKLGPSLGEMTPKRPRFGRLEPWADSQRGSFTPNSTRPRRSLVGSNEFDPNTIGRLGCRSPKGPFGMHAATGAGNEPRSSKFARPSVCARDGCELGKDRIALKDRSVEGEVESPGCDLGCAESISASLRDLEGTVAGTRMRAPKSGGLLERNRLRTSSRGRSGRRLERSGKGPRIAGLELDCGSQTNGEKGWEPFCGDPEQAGPRQDAASARGPLIAKDEEIWFMCEASVKGYR